MIRKFIRLGLFASFSILISACTTIAPQAEKNSRSTTSVEVPHSVSQKSSWFRYSILARQNPNDLWERVRNRFRLNIDTDNPRVAAYIEYYQQNPEHVRRMTERAEPYLYHVVTELDKRHLPAELSLLPIIESGYDPFALSRAGASGLWQIIPSTGQHLGLTQNHHYDGRRDLYDSTQAALNYLESLNTLFEEDWLLSLAAYNAGEGAVSRAIIKNRNLGKDFDYWSLPLPQETKNYVPRFLALCAIINNPEKYNVNLHPIKNAPFVTTVAVNKRLNLVSAAKLADTPLPTLQKLNAGLSRIHSTHHAHLTSIRLPAEKEALFKTRLASFIEPPEKLLTPIKPRHFETKKQFTKVAQKSCGRDMCHKSKYTIAKNNKRNLAYKKHTVKSGESLWSISRLYGISVDELKRVNVHLIKNALKPGDHINLGLR